MIETELIGDKLFLQCYACDPRIGSERGLGARNSLEIVKYFKNVVLITEKASEQGLEGYFPSNVEVVFIDVGSRYRDYCWNQGDWRFYIGYRRWLRKSYEYIKRNYSNADWAWQISMIGFREPGYLYKLDCNTVLGPISSFRNIPKSAFKHLSLLNRLGWIVKNAINTYQQNSFRIKSALAKYSFVLGVTDFDVEKIRRFNEKVYRTPDTGSYELPTIMEREVTLENTLKFLFVGKIVERKGLQIALEAFRLVESDRDFEIIIVGDGPFLDYLKQEFTDLPISFMGKVSIEEALGYYESAHYFLHPSLQDAMSSVYTEALSYGLPVLCFDINGPGETNERNGIPVARCVGNIIEEYAILLSKMLRLGDKDYNDMCYKTYEISKKSSWKNNIKSAITFIAKHHEIISHNNG